MTLTELTVSFLGLVTGYLVVSAVMGRKTKDAPRAPPAPPAPPPPAGLDTDRAVTLSNWYRVLGVREAATRDEITAAYKKLISQYHPDKVAQMGAEIRALAEAKSKQINASYDMGMRLFK
jgi:DnaJ-domain-containing protein 1